MHRVPPTYTNWEGQKFFFARFAREFTILYPPLWNSWRRCWVSMNSKKTKTTTYVLEN